MRYALSNPKIRSKNISILNTLSVISGIITSIIVLKELLTWNAIIGYIIIILGLFIANYLSSIKLRKNQRN